MGHQNLFILCSLYAEMWRWHYIPQKASALESYATPKPRSRSSQTLFMKSTVFTILQPTYKTTRPRLMDGVFVPGVHDWCSRRCQHVEGQPSHFMWPSYRSLTGIGYTQAGRPKPVDHPTTSSWCPIYGQGTSAS